MGGLADVIERPETKHLPLYPEARQDPFLPAELDRSAQNSPHRMRKVRIWDGSWAWLSGSYAALKRVSTDDVHFSADVRNEHYPTQGPAMRETQQNLFIRWDGEPHRRVRHILMKEFGPRAIAELRGAMEQIVSRAIDDLLAMEPPVDLNSAFSQAIPTAAICHIMGVHYDEKDVFQEAALAIVDDHSSEQQVLEAVGAIEVFIRDLIRKRAVQPREDNLISRLVHDFMLNGHVSEDELVNIGWVIIVAGHETTTHAISLGTLGFLLWPDQLKIMLETGGYKRAVEEQLRFWTITQTEPRRVCIKHTVIDGQEIRAGESIIFSLPACNHDPEHFSGSSPDVLDVTRDPQHMVTFGIGHHACLGQGLAKLEVEIVFEQLFKRIPTLKLAVPFKELRFHQGRHQHGLYRLPVTW
jgi:cytochrome P450